MDKQEAIFSLNIDPEAINKMVVDSIIDSAIGKHISEAINDELSKVSRSWDNPYKKIIEREIGKCIMQIIQKDYKEKIHEMVKDKLSQDLVGEVTGRVFDQVIKGY